MFSPAKDKMQQQKVSVAVIVLSKDEELHIGRCLGNVQKISSEIYVVDSESTDRTRKIAEAYGAKVVVHPWPGNHAEQFNWAVDNLPIHSDWVLRLDADEYLTDELIDELHAKLPELGEDVCGVLLPLRRVFLGRTIRRGTGRIILLRLFRRGKGRSEVRLMDEHIELTEGRTVTMQGEFVDDNLNNLSWWTQKHVGYAIREAVDLLDIEYNLTGAAQADGNRHISEQAYAKRLKKHKYSQLPLFWRSTAYFFFRYILRGGFLEGKEGFLWHFLQGWWYRTLVDAKVLEIKSKSGGDRQKIIDILIHEYKIKL